MSVQNIHLINTDLTFNQILAINRERKWFLTLKHEQILLAKRRTQVLRNER